MSLHLESALRSRAAPWIAGVAASLCVYVAWGSLSPWPIMHDEWAYWLQAGQYAALRWSVPPPPVPEFFEQLYVLVTPVFASKYWPGHAITIAPGFALGVPALVPLLLTGLAGALVFASARRVAGQNVAALTFVLWVSTFGNLRFRASYFSELTTSTVWLAAWYALLRWRETRRPAWMAVLAVCTGWGAVTRPATMFVFAIPVGIVVIGDAWRYRLWRHLVLGVLCGTVVLGVLPLWSARTTGDWRTTPLALYTRQYLPFDVPGYVVNDAPPERALPPEMERVRGFLREIKTEQVTAPAWLTFAARAGFMLRDAFAGWRLPLALAFAFGLATCGRIGWFAVGSAVLLVVAYASQAHTRDWTVYYLEAFPAVAFVSALGVRAFLRIAKVGWRPRWLAPIAIVAVVAVAADTASARSILGRVASHTVEFRGGVASLPKSPNVVFVRYAPQRNMHISLVTNEGVLDNARSWIVHDRGADDIRLIGMAKGRTPYLYDEASGRFVELVP